MLKKIFASVLILMFVALSINRVSNWHTHVSSDGVVFQHSHPYSKSEGDEKHSHSSNELSIFVLISDVYDDQIQVDFIPEAKAQENVIYKAYEYIYCFTARKLSLNKSPPALY